LPPAIDPSLPKWYTEVKIKWLATAPSRSVLVSRNHTLKRQIKLAVEVLKKGGLVAYPTDTVYGLGADPLNEKAVARIYEVKNRPHNLPLPLLLADRSDLLKVALIVPEIAWRLVEQFWPGGLTLVVRKSSLVPDSITA
jgi:L-threonylcarbamoyladenylate synthase